MLIWFCLFLFFFPLELRKIVKARTSYGIVGATNGKGEKETVLIVLWLSSLCHLLVFPTHLLGSSGSTELRGEEWGETWLLGGCLVPQSCTAALGVVPELWGTAQAGAGLTWTISPVTPCPNASLGDSTGVRLCQPGSCRTTDVSHQFCTKSCFVQIHHFAVAGSFMTLC